MQQQRQRQIMKLQVRLRKFNQKILIEVFASFSVNGATTKAAGSTGFAEAATANGL